LPAVGPAALAVKHLAEVPRAANISAVTPSLTAAAERRAYYRRIATSSHLIRWLRAELHESRTEARRLQQLRAAEAVERLGQSFSGNSARRAYVVTV
jgi:hypothetical protein